MRYSLLLLATFLAFATGLKAQIASTICLEEVKTSFGQIAPSLLLKAEQATQIDYQHHYVMRSDPQKEEHSGIEKQIYAKDFFLHNSPDAFSITDAKEAFNQRKYQYVIYRTPSSLAKARLIPMADLGIFDHCTVRKCHFVPAPGEDSISHKRAFMTLDPAGQKKYQIQDFEIITNPHDTTLVRIKVNFTSRSIYLWAEYTFLNISPNSEVSTKSAHESFLTEDGDLKETYKGFELKDYR